MGSLKLKEEINLLSDNSGCRLRLTVTEYVDTDPNVFVYQRRAAAPLNPAVDDYVHVASINDMAALPATTPGSDSPYFRLYYMDLVFQSADLMLETLEVIREEVKGLLDNKIKLAAQGVLHETDFIA